MDEGNYKSNFKAVDYLHEACFFGKRIMCKCRSKQDCNKKTQKNEDTRD